MFGIFERLFGGFLARQIEISTVVLSKDIARLSELMGRDTWSGSSDRRTYLGSGESRLRVVRHLDDPRSWTITYSASTADGEVWLLGMFLAAVSPVGLHFGGRPCDLLAALMRIMDQSTASFITHPHLVCAQETALTIKQLQGW